MIYDVDSFHYKYASHNDGHDRNLQKIVDTHIIHSHAHTHISLIVLNN